MSSDEVAACRQCLESHLQSLVDRRGSSRDSAVSDGECGNLLEDIRRIWTRHNNVQWTVDHSPVDTALRELLFDLISAISITEPAFIEVWYLLDITTILADHGLSEPASNFLMIENLLDSQTVSGCRRVFDYLESRRERLTAKNFDRKTLVILRCCNELLRRLSRAEDTVFCGRVFIFLFQSFPLGDRSSVNLRGVFHTENVTHFDADQKPSADAVKPMDVDVEGGFPSSSGARTPASGVDVDTTQKTGRNTPLPARSKPDTKLAPPDLDSLYPQFWSLQNLFSQPTTLFEPTGLKQFKDGMAAVLACFKALSANTASSSAAPDRGTKRKRGETDGATTSQPYNPKYLTNRDLFDLEVHDVAFRRHILAQALIMLDFLLSLSPSAKAKNQGLTNNSVLYGFTLSDEDVKYCQTTRNAIAGFLQQQGPGNDGKSYYRMVDTVLSRDKNWARWKASACPPIQKPAVGVDVFMTSQRSLLETTGKRPFPNPPGAQDFDFLAHAEPLEALKHPSQREDIRSLEDYYNEIEAAKLDEDFATDEEKKELQEKIQGSLWRALRASALVGRRFELCEKIKDGVNTKALKGEETPPAEEVEAEPVQSEAEEVKPSTNGHASATEDVGSAAGTPIPQIDGADDAPQANGEDIAESQAENEGEDDAEFAPPGAMDIDDGGISGAPEVDVPVPADEEPAQIDDGTAEEAA
ncbi:THO complex subunit 1 [Cyphellophora attinorum]|uniref:THO complex subunit 1 n=1 Tax=Cyphellophora attinorum TaxID=1664694 RepID=A0A0N1H3G3_9EURO|nr:THO complex subunit 1 [Phialophora attinorum]KPI39550.1 THO complex subunit 1 [Phialophora attinorum]